MRDYRISTEHFGSVLGVVVRELLDKREFAGYPRRQYGCMCIFCGRCHTHDMRPTNKKMKVK